MPTDDEAERVLSRKCGVTRVTVRVAGQGRSDSQRPVEWCEAVVDLLEGRNLSGSTCKYIASIRSREEEVKWPLTAFLVCWWLSLFCVGGGEHLRLRGGGLVREVHQGGRAGSRC